MSTMEEGKTYEHLKTTTIDDLTQLICENCRTVKTVNNTDLEKFRFEATEFRNKHYDCIDF